MSLSSLYVACSSRAGKTVDMIGARVKPNNIGVSALRTYHWGVRWRLVDSESLQHIQETYIHVDWFFSTGFKSSDDHRYVPFVTVTIQSFPRLWPIAGLLMWVTQWVHIVEQKLLTPHGTSEFTLVCNEILLNPLFFCVVFCRPLIVFIFLSLHSLFFFNMRLFNTPLTSSIFCQYCGVKINKHWIDVTSYTINNHNT